MPRLTLIHTQQEFVAAAEGRTGRHVLLNALFDSGTPEAIRLNLAAPNCSYYSPSHGLQIFPRGEVPFQVLSPAVLLSVTELADWVRNFSFVEDAAGNVSWGQIRQDDPVNDLPLQRLQSILYQFLYTDSLLNDLPVETDLYNAYLNHPRSLRLFDGNEVSNAGQELLNNFSNAATCYVQIPQLREYFIQENVQEGDLGPSGERFRQWFQQNFRLPVSGEEVLLEYVAYALRPLRISGAEFYYNQLENDTRGLSVDLLFRYNGLPVWTELKMVGDTWTSSALQQILLYGSAVAGEHQANRFQSIYGAEFGTGRHWLAVLVEDRDDPAFQADFDQTLRFVQLPTSIPVIQEYFRGMILGKIKKDGDQWEISDWNVVE
ncbi:hypothetical protein [Rubinisphaera italica]|uniref:Uncharacterized protein n=1 Tax=Rubinisphaera italica TaxID=2527969 RepID=A0A5C5XCG4_9PLAN|nr:hypothetical protein [Rubinisphaera italica]TWT60837.1 hypothetical protein Pan54_15640 [Rubinisphaera italica]